MRALRWLVRARTYSDIGLWYFPGVDSILPIVLGVIERSPLIAIGAYFGIRVISLSVGYADVHHLKRIQYQNRFGTELNPYLLKEIRRRNK